MNPHAVINGTAAAIRFYPMLKIVYQLSKKPNKTKEEEEVLKSFKKAVITTLAVTLIAVGLLGFAVLNLMFSMPYGDQGSGRVEGNQVKYIQNTWKYQSLEDLNINPSDVKEGDRILLWFNPTNDKITEAIPKTTYDEQTHQKIYLLLFVTIGSIIGLVATSYVIRKITSAKFYRWYAKQ